MLRAHVAYIKANVIGPTKEIYFRKSRVKIYLLLKFFYKNVLHNKIRNISNLTF